MTAGIAVRVADEDDRVDVARIVDGALLALDDDERAAALVRGDVLVAVDGDGDDERVLGTIVLDDGHVEALAVRRRDRREGIGSALLEAAVAREGRLTADFPPELRSFYEALGFEVTDREGRPFGVWEPDGGSDGDVSAE